MTVATNLALPSHQIEYILAVEGVGWLTDETDFSSGFDGDVFVTADLNGDLATVLGCTIHKGLELPSSIGDTLDPVEAKYKLSGLNVSIKDVDDWFSANFVPHTVGNRGTISTSALTWDLTTVTIASYEYAASSIVWVGGREAILLGTKSGAGPWTYTGSTRGYLGTPQGSQHHDPYGSITGFAWPIGSTTDDVHRFWYDRNMALYMHVPGEAVGNVYLLWMGRLRGMSNPDSGLEWKLQGVGDFIRLQNRMRRGKAWKVRGASFTSSPRVNYLENIATTPGGDSTMTRTVLNLASYVNDRYVLEERYGLAAFYNYRCTNGGTAGMKSTWDPKSTTGVQAYDDTNIVDTIAQFCKVGDNIFWAVCKAQPDDDAGSAIVGYPFMIELHRFAFNSAPAASDDGMGYQSTPIDEGAEVQFLLDNWPDNYVHNRYAVDKRVRRHPVDVFLCHLLTMNNEFYIGDATGTPSATSIQFSSPGWSTDQWVGYALHGTEQGGNCQFQAQLITANTADTLTLSPGFRNTPTAGDEFQIRNALYDVLPLGWGMSLHHRQVDVAAFEKIRDERLPGAEVGKFIMGMEREFDLFSFLDKNILRPYGIALYMDGATHKLTPVYVGHPYTDGILETYTTIANNQVLSRPQLDYQFNKPLGGFKLKVRETENRPVTYYSVDDMYSSQTLTYDPLDGQHSYKTELHTGQVVTLAEVPVEMRGPTYEMHITSSEVEKGGSLEGVDMRSVSALFNTKQGDVAMLAARLQGLVLMYQIPPVRARLRVASALTTQLQIGTLVAISLDTWPTNPFAATRGWTAVVGRVLSRKFSGRMVGLEIDLELLQELPGGLIAPAAKVSGFGNDGTNYYFDVEDSEYIFDATNDKDWYYFNTGDVIELRREAGSVRDSPFTIAGFGGATQAASQSTPQGASPSRIWVGSANPISGATLTSDYLVYTTYSTGHSANMKKHAVFGDANGLINSGADTGYDYGL